MTSFRLAITAAILAMILSACDSHQEAEAPDNPLLTYVPSNTPYLAANLEPLPAAVVDEYLARMQPVIDEMQSRLSGLRADLEVDHSDRDPVDRLALAVARELDGKLSRAGLSSLGLDIISPKVIYGMGLFPVIRIGLSDPATLRATVQRVLEDAALDPAERTHDGVAFWRVALDGDVDAPLSLYLSILQDHMALAVLPTAFEAELLPPFLGLALPADAAAGAQLAELNRRNGYTAYGSAIVDLRRLAEQFLQAESITARFMASTGEFDPAAFDERCATEIYEIIENVPRITAGTTEFSAAAIAYQYRLESPPALAGALRKLVAVLPAADPESQRILELSLGLRLGAARDFLREKAMAIVEQPYSCELLQEVNTRAEQSLAQLDQPMPPFFNNFRGLRVAVSEVDPGPELVPADARGHLALHVEQPEMFVGMAQMFLPDLATLALAPGNGPEQIPQSLIPVPDVVAFAAMTDDAIGLSVGPGEEKTLPQFLARESGPDGVFLSAVYDTATYSDYTQQMSHLLRGADGASHSDDKPAAEAIADAARTAFRAMADRGYATVRFGPQGLEIDGRQTFKP